MYRKNCIEPLKFRRRLLLKCANILSPSKMQLGKRKGNCKKIGEVRGMFFSLILVQNFKGESKGHVLFNFGKFPFLFLTCIFDGGKIIATLKLQAVFSIHQLLSFESGLVFFFLILGGLFRWVGSTHPSIISSIMYFCIIMYIFEKKTNT